MPSTPTFCAATLRMIRPDRVDEVHPASSQGHGIRHQAAEVARCLRQGLTERPSMPLDESVSVMRTLDEVRRQIGLRSPPEQPAQRARGL